jgi:chromosome segregation ATPase
MSSEDSSFKDFMRRNSVNWVVRDPTIIRPQFFALPVEEKISVFNKFIEIETPATMMFTAQFMINSMLLKRNQELQSDLQAVPDRLLEELHVRSAEEIPKVFEDLNHQLQVLQAENEKLDAKFRRMEDLLMKRLQKDSDQVSRIRLLGNQNRDLEREKQLLERKVEVVEASFVAAKTEMASQSLLEESNSIAQLAEENRTLSTQLNATTKYNESRFRKLQKREQIRAQEYEELAQVCESLKRKFQESQKKSKRRLEELTDQCQEQIARLKTELSESEANHQKVLAQMNANCEQATQRWNEQLVACKRAEQDVQQLTSKLSALQNMERSLKSQLEMAQSRAEKQKESAQGQASAQKMAFEAQMRDLAERHQSQMKTQLDSLYDQLVAILDAEGADRPLIRDESFSQVLNSIRLAIARRKR